MGWNNLCIPKLLRFLYLNTIVLPRQLIGNVSLATLIILLVLQPQSKCLFPNIEELLVTVTSILMMIFPLMMWVLQPFMLREYLMMYTIQCGSQAPYWTMWSTITYRVNQNWWNATLFPIRTANFARLYINEIWQEKNGNLVKYTETRIAFISMSIRKALNWKSFLKNCSRDDKTFWSTVFPFMTNRNNKNGRQIILQGREDTVTYNHELAFFFND